eukprot:15365959-Ditylum_brightwellii.AAC.1
MAHNIKKHLPCSTATSKGHMHQQRKNLQSTSRQSNPNMSPSRENRTSDMFVALGVTNEKGTLYTDLTGKFPLTSISSGKYVLIAYDYDSNAILAKVVKSRNDMDMQYSRKSIVLARGTAQPPSLCSTDPDFPLYLWDTLIPQASLTLNLLQRSRTNPKLSVHPQLNGSHDFNAVPLSLMGTRAVVYDDPNEHGSWAPHGTEVWYIGSAPEHYHCYTFYVPSTKATYTAAMADFFPIHCQIPKTIYHQCCYASS